MGIMVDGVWHADGTFPTDARTFRACAKWLSQLGDALRASPDRAATAVSRLSPAAIICIFRTPVRGRIARDLSPAQATRRGRFPSRWSIRSWAKTDGPSPLPTKPSRRGPLVTKSMARVTCTRSMARPATPIADASRCRCCGTRKSARSSTMNRPRSSGCSIVRLTSGATRPSTFIRLTCAPKSIASMRWFTRTSTMASIDAASRLRRPHMKRRFDSLFRTLDELEARFARQRYLAGDRITEADWRLFTTLVRFDAVYYVHFKCNLRHISEYPNLWNYTRELYQVPGVAETVNLAQIKRHYYASHQRINPTADRRRKAPQSISARPMIAIASSDERGLTGLQDQSTDGPYRGCFADWHKNEFSVSAGRGARGAPRWPCIRRSDEGGGPRASGRYQRRRRLNACGPFSPGRVSNCTSTPSRRSSK